MVPPGERNPLAVRRPGQLGIGAGASQGCLTLSHRRSPHRCCSPPAVTRPARGIGDPLPVLGPVQRLDMLAVGVVHVAGKVHEPSQSRPVRIHDEEIAIDAGAPLSQRDPAAIR